MAETKSGLPKLLSLGGFLRKDIECVVCQEVMTATILQCRNGHCVCETCYKRLLGSCPCCRIRLDEEPIRNRLAESFCREIFNKLNENGPVDENEEEEPSESQTDDEVANDE